MRRFDEAQRPASHRRSIHFHFVTDPDLKVATLHGLRWDVPGETACPPTVVVDRQGVARFVRVSRSRGDRSAAPDVLQVLSGLK